MKNRPHLGFSRSHKDHNFYSKTRCAGRNREIILKAKCRPCTDCKVQYNPWVMQFDHRDPLQKKFNLSKSKTCSVKILLTELAKCDVVCANCHAERTARGQHWAVRRDVVEKTNQMEFDGKGTWLAGKP